MTRSPSRCPCFARIRFGDPLRLWIATAALAFACPCSLARGEDDLGIEFTATALGAADPAAVLDDTIEEDNELRSGTGLVNLVEFRDVLRRGELAALLSEGHASPEVRRAIWECAVQRWPGFVDALAARRRALRDAILDSSREWGLQLDAGNSPDPKLMAKHSRNVVRIQSERAAAEVRFLAELADCACARLASQPSDAPETPETPETPDAPLQIGPAKLLEPLVQRAKLRNTNSSILGRPPRWIAVDPRNALAMIDAAPFQRDAVDDLLSAFEASRTSLLLARYQAEWRALGTEDAVRRNAWRRVEALERRIRQETRAAIRNIAEMLDGEDGDRLQLLAARAAYPEVAPALEEIEGLLQDGGRRISKDAPGADAGVPREELLAAVRRVIEDLDMTGERDGFLWIRGGDPAMTESIEGARAKLDAVVERWR